MHSPGSLLGLMYWLPGRKLLVYNHGQSLSYLPAEFLGTIEMYCLVKTQGVQMVTYIPAIFYRFNTQGISLKQSDLLLQVRFTHSIGDYSGTRLVVLLTVREAL